MSHPPVSLLIHFRKKSHSAHLFGYKCPHDGLQPLPTFCEFESSTPTAEIPYEFTKEFILDFSECKYLGEIHQTIQSVLELPDWYEQNLDALWNTVTGLIFLPTNVTIIFQPQTKQTLQLADEVKKIIDVFKEAENEHGEITLNIIM